MFQHVDIDAQEKQTNVTILAYLREKKMTLVSPVNGALGKREYLVPLYSSRSTVGISIAMI